MWRRSLHAAVPTYRYAVRTCLYGPSSTIVLPWCRWASTTMPAAVPGAPAAASVPPSPFEVCGRNIDVTALRPPSQFVPADEHIYAVYEKPHRGATTAHSCDIIAARCHSASAYRVRQKLGCTSLAACEATHALSGRECLGQSRNECIDPCALE